MLGITEISYFLKAFFLDLGLKNITDIGIVALLIYFALIFIRRTKLFFIFNTIIVLWLIISVAKIFDLKLTKVLLEPFITFFLLIIIIVFQREIRRFFEWLSLHGINASFFKHKQTVISKEILKETTKAVNEMANNKVGALIVFEGQHPLGQKVFEGISINGLISSEILMSIFNSNTPGHDGAVIISDNKISQFSVHLPLAISYKNLNKAGTRHHAAVGITEISDALAIVVSEERGTVSIAKNGALSKVNKEQFEKILLHFIDSQISVQTYNTKKFLLNLVTRNWIEKASAIIIAITLWVTLVLS